jgi:hypothetical protein
LLSHSKAKIDAEIRASVAIEKEKFNRKLLKYRQREAELMEKVNVLMSISEEVVEKEKMIENFKRDIHELKVTVLFIILIL